MAKTDEQEKKKMDIQIDVIASQKKDKYTKKKINDLAKERKGNTEIDNEEGSMKIGVIFEC